jgi:hypothetical protein
VFDFIQFDVVVVVVWCLFCGITSSVVVALLAISGAMFVPLGRCRFAFRLP